MGERSGPETLLVGAHFACRRCLRRGLSPICGHCGSPTVDLERDEGAEFLRQARLTAVIEPNRASLARWWGRRTKWDRIEWVAAALGGLAMIVGVLSASGPTDGSTRLLVIPFYFLFTLLIRLILFLGGLLLRLFMTLVLLVASLVVAVAESVLRRDGGWATKIFEIIPKLVDFGARGRWTSEPLAPRWSKTSLEGTLERVSNESSDESEPLGIRRFVGKVGDMVHCDAIVPGFEIRTSDDEVVRVELELGGVVVTSSTGSPVERATLTRDDPKWLSGETELAPCRIAPGTLVALAGGVWSETESGLGGGDDFRHAPRIRVLRGTTEEPLWVAFEDRP